MAAAKRVAQRVPDFEEFNSYEAWKAAAALACLEVVESATESPELGMTPPEVRTKNLHPNSRCFQQVPPAKKSSAMLRT